jgi:hypothetical protein
LIACILEIILDQMRTIPASVQQIRLDRASIRGRQYRQLARVSG